MSLFRALPDCLVEFAVYRYGLIGLELCCKSSFEAGFLIGAFHADLTDDDASFLVVWYVASIGYLQSVLSTPEAPINRRGASRKFRLDLNSLHILDDLTFFNFRSGKRDPLPDGGRGSSMPGDHSFFPESEQKPCCLP